MASCWGSWKSILPSGPSSTVPLCTILFPLLGTGSGRESCGALNAKSSQRDFTSRLLGCQLSKSSFVFLLGYIPP